MKKDKKFNSKILYITALLPAVLVGTTLNLSGGVSPAVLLGSIVVTPLVFTGLYFASRGVRMFMNNHNRKTGKKLQKQDIQLKAKLTMQDYVQYEEAKARYIGLKSDQNSVNSIQFAYKNFKNKAKIYNNHIADYLSLNGKNKKQFHSFLKYFDVNNLKQMPAKEFVGEYLEFKKASYEKESLAKVYSRERKQIEKITNKALSKNKGRSLKEREEAISQLRSKLHKVNDKIDSSIKNMEEINPEYKHNDKALKIKELLNKPSMFETKQNNSLPVNDNVVEVVEIEENLDSNFKQENEIKK